MYGDLWRSFISDAKEKVNVFSDYFASQASVPNSDSAEIPGGGGLPYETDGDACRKFWI